VRFNRTCSCGQQYFLQNLSQTGFQFHPQRPGRDTIQTCINRFMRGQDPESIHKGVTSGCDKGCTNATIAPTYTIESTPEYLRVVLYLFDRAGNKYTGPVTIEEILDLTQYMTFQNNPLPVRYRLTSAAHHIGAGMAFGHYGAGVTSWAGRGGGPRVRGQAAGPNREPQWFCNDGNIML
jgi:hypothetical protein